MLMLAETDLEKQTVLEYLAAKIDTKAENIAGTLPFQAFTVVKRGEGVGAVLFTNFRGTSIEVVWAGEPGWVNLRDMQALFAYPFIQLGVLRAWGCVKRSNSESRNLAVRLGCREVGILRDEYGPGSDAVLYEMTRGRCKWLAGKGESHGTV